jgi:hypothetical protein
VRPARCLDRDEKCVPKRKGPVEGILPSVGAVLVDPGSPPALTEVMVRHTYQLLRTDRLAGDKAARVM